MTQPSEKTYSVEGMTCEHCELSVREEVEGLDGVEYARADRISGRLVVGGESIDDDAVGEAVATAGYTLTAAGAAGTRSDESPGSGE